MSLNLTDDQYEAAYEINLDYLMGVNTVDDVYGLYWERRNLDLSYVLLDWQYRAYLAASYFYRPLYWSAGVWHFGIYARYPYRDYFYFGRPHFYVTYRGAHAWHRHGGRSWYHGRTWASPGRGGHHFGMHDRFQRGDFGRGHRFGQSGHSGASGRPKLWRTLRSLRPRRLFRPVGPHPRQSFRRSEPAWHIQRQQPCNGQPVRRRLNGLALYFRQRPFHGQPLRIRPFGRAPHFRPFAA